MIRFFSEKSYGLLLPPLHHMEPIVVLLHSDLGEHLRLARGEMSSRRNGEKGHQSVSCADAPLVLVSCLSF